MAFEFLNGLIYFSPNHTITTCATDIQMETRKSWWFFSNVGFNDVIAVPQIFLTIYTMLRLWNKSYFSASTRVLVWASLINGLLHTLVYAFIQNWSLFRALMYYGEPCKIMFNEYECFPLYTLDIFARLLMITTDVAISIDGFLIFSPRFRPTKLRGVLLYGVAIVFAIFLCRWLTSDGPNDNALPNCLSRQGRGTGELVHQVLFYLAPIVCCFVSSGGSRWFGKRCVKKGYTCLQKSYEDKIILDSSRLIFWNIFVSMAIMSFYSLSTLTLILFKDSIRADLIQNGVLWCYTSYPLACLLRPIAVNHMTKYIDKERKAKIEKETRETDKAATSNDYFASFAKMLDDRHIALYGNQVAPADSNRPRRHLSVATISYGVEA